MGTFTLYLTSNLQILSGFTSEAEVNLQANSKMTFSQFLADNDVELDASKYAVGYNNHKYLLGQEILSMFPGNHAIPPRVEVNVIPINEVGNERTTRSNNNMKNLPRPQIFQPRPRIISNQNQGKIDGEFRIPGAPVGCNRGNVGFVNRQANGCGQVQREDQERAEHFAAMQRAPQDDNESVLSQDADDEDPAHLEAKRLFLETFKTFPREDLLKMRQELIDASNGANGVNGGKVWKWARYAPLTKSVAFHIFNL